jgi:ubiquinone/menaquinone biosynthesis C-methylase UbiE
MGDGHWQLEGSAAELYQRYLVPLITSKWAEDLVHRAELREGEDVLDVACGTGVVARLAARKVAGNSQHPSVQIESRDAPGPIP